MASLTRQSDLNVSSWAVVQDSEAFESEPEVEIDQLIEDTSSALRLAKSSDQALFTDNKQQAALCTASSMGSSASSTLLEDHLTPPASGTSTTITASCLPDSAQTPKQASLKDIHINESQMALANGVLKMNLRHLQVSAEILIPLAADKQNDLFAESVPSADRFTEILNNIFGKQFKPLPQMAIQNNDIDPTDRLTAMPKSLHPTESQRATKRDKPATISPVLLIPNKRQRRDKPLGTTPEKVVEEELVEVWTLKINRLLKGKISFTKPDLRDLQDMLQRISVVLQRGGIDVKTAGALRDNLVKLSDMQDIPFGDEYGLRRHALKLVKRWKLLVES
ncbi:hypothetical protein H0H92_013305 [Tricholoma furcatifolium]|nr:hypothetical protein H0H92_013305 [Tricholoma furcatifolium]